MLSELPCDYLQFVKQVLKILRNDVMNQFSSCAIFENNHRIMVFGSERLCSSYQIAL